LFVAELRCGFLVEFENPRGSLSSLLDIQNQLYDTLSLHEMLLTSSSKLIEHEVSHIKSSVSELWHLDFKCDIS
jgi:hypothetical protein